LRRSRPDPFSSQGESAISNKVFVGNLSFDATREEILEVFGAAGRVVDVKVPTDRETGRPRGFAFVEFESDDAAQQAIAKLNGQNVRGRPLRVNEAENRPPRPPGSAPVDRPAYRPPSSFGAPSAAARPLRFRSRLRMPRSERNRLARSSGRPPRKRSDRDDRRSVAVET
jgi:cold-inducible RNA-binding protein